MQLDLFWCSQSKQLSCFRLDSALLFLSLCYHGAYTSYPLLARTVWRQPDFLTLPNFALLVLVCFGRNKRNVPLHINLPASSSRVKFSSGVFGVLTTFHHIPFRSCCTITSVWKYLTLQCKSKPPSPIHISFRKLFFGTTQAQVNSSREPSLSDHARCCFWFVAPLLISLCSTHRPVLLSKGPWDTDQAFVFCTECFCSLSECLDL